MSQEAITVDYIRSHYPTLQLKATDTLQKVVDILGRELVTTAADLKAVTRDSLASVLPALALDALKPKPTAENEITEAMLKRYGEELLDQYNIKRRRIEGKRPGRLLSWISKSHAFQTIESEQRLERGVDFFFPLVEADGFECTAFAADAPDKKKDENKFHHPYFIAEVNLLVQAAKAAGIHIKQQLYWSKSGKWMKLDDGNSAGVEPDFCMTRVFDENLLVPDISKEVVPPQSKYDVSITLEQKKEFTDSDQIEALDYGERLLCFQRGRRVAYSALFHCCQREKIIRWLEIREENGKFCTRITRAQSLAPGEAGQRELLTILTKSSAELGLDFPNVYESRSNELVKITALLGEGATSTVYAANFQGQLGVLKLLKSGFEHLADHEEDILRRLEAAGVSGLPTNCTIIRDGALFFGEELTHIESLNRAQFESLIDCLEGAHTAGVIHRDVRPDNIMQDTNGNVRLIDWGFAHQKSLGHHAGQHPPDFAGTFRYAGDEVLESAIGNGVREPKPHDDLESLAKVVVAFVYGLHPDISMIADGDLMAAQRFWSEKRSANQKFEWIFEAAKTSQYKLLKESYFG